MDAVVIPFPQRDPVDWCFVCGRVADLVIYPENLAPYGTCPQHREWTP